jgi:hypothetical protein
MPDYKLYFLDEDGRIRRALDLECRDDEQALSVVREHVSDQAMELWCGRRLVRGFPPGRS